MEYQHRLSPVKRVLVPSSWCTVYIITLLYTEYITFFSIVYNSIHCYLHTAQRLAILPAVLGIVSSNSSKL